MTEAVKAQLRAQGVKLPADKGNTRAKPKSPTQEAADSKSAYPDTTGERDTPKEVAGPKPDTPLRWQLAGPLFTDQYPGWTRAVILCPTTLWPAVEAALTRIEPVQS